MTPPLDAPAPVAGARRLGGDVSLRVAARIGAAGMQAATLLLLARSLGPSSFGVFAVFSATGMLLTALACLGSSMRVLRLRAEQEAEALLPALFWIQAAGATLVLAVLLVASVVVGNPAPAVVGALLAFSDQQMEFRVSHLSGDVRQTAASLSILAQRGLALAAVGVAALLALPALLLLGVALVLVAVIAVVPAPARRVAPRTLLRFARSSLGYWFGGLVTNLRQLEPLVVSATGGVGAAGFYAIAVRVSNPLSIVVTSLQAVAVPEMARASDRAEFRRMFRLLLTVALVYAGVLVAGSPLVADVFLAVVGHRYDGARTLVTVMVVCAGLSAVSQALQARLIAAGRPATSGWIIGGATLLGLGVLAVTSATAGGAYLWIAPLVTQGTILAALAVVPVRGPAPASAPSSVG